MGRVGVSCSAMNAHHLLSAWASPWLTSRGLSAVARGLATPALALSLLSVGLCAGCEDAGSEAVSGPRADLSVGGDSGAGDVSDADISDLSDEGPRAGDAEAIDAGAPDTGATDAGEPDAELPDVGPPPVPEAPSEIEADAPFTPERESVWPAAVEQIFTLPEGALLVMDAEGPLRLSPTLEGAPVLDGAADGDRLGGEADLVDEVYAVAPVEGGLLVATDSGLMALDGGELWRSPLDMLLPSPAVALAATGDGALWTAHSEGARRWSSGAVVALWLEGAPLSAAALVEGPDGDVWAAEALGGAPGRLLRLWVEPDGLRALPGPPRIQPEALAVDGDGNLWALDDGELWRRDLDGAWAWWRLPSAAHRLWASPQAGDVWINTDEALWHHRAGRFRRAGAPLDAVATLEADGALVAGDEGGVWRLRAERRVILSGVEDGDTLRAPRPISIRPDQPDRVTAVAHRFEDEGGAILPGGGPIQGPPWGLTLDPSALTPGVVILVVEATYEDEQILTARLALDVLDVAPPTWGEDIAPIFTARCAGACHGEGGDARPLYTPAQWQMYGEAILDAITIGRMPLPPNPPVPPAEISLIEAWMESGFLE